MNNKQKAIAWAEYVLPIFEAKFPEDDRPRKAIEAARKGSDIAAYLAADVAYIAARATAARAAFAAAAAEAAAFAATIVFVATYAPAAATNAATYAAEAAEAAAFAAANAAARAIIHDNYGEDKVAIAKVNLIWTKEEQLKISSKIEWLEYKPTEVWKAMLSKWMA